MIAAIATSLVAAIWTTLSSLELLVAVVDVVLVTVGLLGRHLYVIDALVIKGVFNFLLVFGLLTLEVELSESSVVVVGSVDVLADVMAGLVRDFYKGRVSKWGRSYS